MVAKAKRDLAQQSKTAAQQTMTEERSVKISDRKQETAHLAKDQEGAADEAESKQVQNAKISIFRTAAKVARQKLTSMELKSTDLGEKDASLTEARATMEENDRRANDATIQLQKMTSDNSLHRINNMLGDIKHGGTEASGSTISNAEAKVDLWFQNFNRARSQEVSQDMEQQDTATRAEEASDRSQEDLGEPGSVSVSGGLSKLEAEDQHERAALDNLSP